MDKNFNCNTKYPLFFVHGMGFRDGRICYWGRIPKILKQYGAEMFFGCQDASASIEDNAEILKKSLLKFIAETGVKKVNIIAHSKGGLEARYLISTMGMGKYIASVTTLSTPHNGSVTMDKLMKLPKCFLVLGSKIFDIFQKIGGDKNPDTFRCLEQVTTSYMAEFNRNNPDDKNIYYRSYAFKMKNSFSDIIMAIPYFAVRIMDGESDGLLTAKEVAWGDFRGVYTGIGNRGISHPDEVDLRRMKFSRKIPHNKNEISDIIEFYINLVSELKVMGY
ncbi:MAG: alpha/beta hydrolase [Ruminococcus sp.]|nr:alpha/beta hydrolase [Ruminococcus sp.]